MSQKSHTPEPQSSWQDFIEQGIYADHAVPWKDDPAYPHLCALPGLRDSIGGRTSDALKQTIGLVHAMARVDLRTVVGHLQPTHGLCLGFGMNLYEPFDVLQSFGLNCVHAYEWIGEQVREAAHALAVLPAEEPPLARRIRLYHGTISDMQMLPDQSIQLVYSANVFHSEIPMTTVSFRRAVHEIVRVLASDGIVISRGSAGDLESSLSSYGRWLLRIPLVSVFQKGKEQAAHD